MKLLYEDETWRITRKGRKYPMILIEKFNSVQFKRMYEIHLPAASTPDFDWWMYGYSICTSKPRRIMSTPVPRISDIERIIQHRSKFEIPVVLVDELNAILMAEKMVQHV